jgi:hypothetical protein
MAILPVAAVATSVAAPVQAAQGRRVHQAGVPARPFGEGRLTPLRGVAAQQLKIIVH